MHKLAASNRCHLFKIIAADVWDLIVANTNSGVHTDEDGITNNIIGAIRRHANSIPNFGVWSNRGYKENMWGSDIDVFVETAPNQFVWYALQAKVISKGVYKDLYTQKGGEYQWDKLERLESLAQCEIRYLLYNGVPGYAYAGKDQCSFDFNEKQFGCALVTVADIKAKVGRVAKFLDFHPKKAQPWRVIVCCYTDVDDVTTYSTEQVRRAINHYPKDERRINPEILDSDDNEKISDGQENPNFIVNASETAGWSPDATMVIRNTASLR